MQTHIENLPAFYEKSSSQTKREMVSSIFPKKIAIGEDKSRTAKINEAVLLISATDKGFSGKGPGQLFKNLELSRQVDRISPSSNCLVVDLKNVVDFELTT